MRNLLLGIFRTSSIMSHIKNVDAYSRLVGLCTGYGGKYNPGQQNLQPALDKEVSVIIRLK